MKLKYLLATLTLTWTISSNAFVIVLNDSSVSVKSPITPLNGIYVTTSTNFCTVDSANIPLPQANAPTSFNSVTVEQIQFTPDATNGGANNAAAFAAWVNYLATKDSTISNPASALNKTQDPTTSSVLKLIETPIEWGIASGTGTETIFNTPISFKPIDNLKAKNKPAFITSFTYSLPANNINIPNGYALYAWSSSSNSWKRFVLYLSQPANVKSTSFVAHKIDAEPGISGNVTYTYDCVHQMHSTQ